MSLIDGGWKRAGHPFPFSFSNREYGSVEIAHSLRLLYYSHIKQRRNGDSKMAKLTPAARKARNGRTAALTVFLSGAAASVGANLLASDGTPLGMIVAAFPALMLLGSVYLLENGTTHPTWVRWAIFPVILVAAWMSYWHIVEVVNAAGEGVATAHLYAIIVDLPMIIASAALRPAPARPVARKRAPAKKVTNVTPIRKVAP